MFFVVDQLKLVLSLFEPIAGIHIRFILHKELFPYQQSPTPEQYLPDDQ